MKLHLHNGTLGVLLDDGTWKDLENVEIEDVKLLGPFPTKNPKISMKLTLTSTLDPNTAAATMQDYRDGRTQNTQEIMNDCTWTVLILNNKTIRTTTINGIKCDIVPVDDDFTVLVNGIDQHVLLPSLQEAQNFCEILKYE
jgi:hypothetical protein